MPRTTPPHPDPVGVMGAGAIGGYLGGRLAAAGTPVILIGRPRLGRTLREASLRLTDLDGADVRLPPAPARITFAEDPAALAGCGVVLLTVKSGDTPEAGEALAHHLRPDAAVISFQNGLRNADVLADALRRGAPGRPPTAVRGMVAFNVVRRGPGHLHRGTEGPLVTAPLPAAHAGLTPALRAAGFDAFTHRDMPGVLASKLVLNLNNAINALSGLPLYAQIRDRRYRRVMSAVMAEGLSTLRAAGLRPRPLGHKIRPGLARWVLRLPDPLFVRVARRLLDIDPEARTSMAHDLARGRTTEIAELNGEIVRLGAQHGHPTPLNRHLVERVRAAEAAGAGAPGLPPEALLPER